MPQRRPPAQPLLPRWLLVAAPVAAVAALVAALVVGAGTGEPAADGDPTPYGDYAADVRQAFDDSSGPLVDMAQVSARWVDGDASDAQLAAALDAAEPALPHLRSTVEDLDEPGGVAPAERFYLACVDLYAQVVATHRAALAAEGRERVERSLLARRLGVLADRSYDRARAIVEPAPSGPEATARVSIDPVPDWEAEGLAPGELLGGAGDGFDAQAAERAIAGTERAHRQGVQLLVLADAERARNLGLDEIAASLELVASRMTG